MTAQLITSVHANAWVEPAIEKVYQEIDHGHEYSGDNGACHHHRKIAGGDRLDEEPTKPRPGKNRLHHDGALHQGEVAAAIAIAQDVARRVRGRQPDQLDPWLARAAKSPLVPLPRCAKGLRDDDDAVNAGVTLPWRTGPVEGQMNRLNMRKRQMVGRANLDLLQPRFLLAASGRYDGGYRGAGLHHQHGVGVPAGSLRIMRPGRTP
jgi:hypothetical protein